MTWTSPTGHVVRTCADLAALDDPDDDPDDVDHWIMPLWQFLGRPDPDAPTPAAPGSGRATDHLDGADPPPF